MTDLYEEASSLGVEVEAAPLEPGLNGFYDDDSRTIYLDWPLPGWQERSTLAHEVSHARWRDCGHVPAHEARADAEAARSLITAEEYAEAEREVGPEPAALAEHLNVCTWVIEAWQGAARVGRRWTRHAPRRS